MSGDRNSSGTPASYAPTIFVGLGGSGLRAARFALLGGTPPNHQLGPLDRGLAEALDTDLVTSIGVDTSIADFGEIEVTREMLARSDAHALDDGLLPFLLPTLHKEVLLSRTEINQMLGSIRRVGRKRAETGGELLAKDDETNGVDWLLHGFGLPEDDLDKVLPATDRGSDGAGQLRLLGKLALLAGLENIITELESAHRRVSKETARGEARFVILSSLAGGTGSGMALDIAFLVRKFVSRTAPITGHFLLPDVFVGRPNTDRIAPNTYAALSELSVLAQPSNPEPVNIDYRRNGMKQSFKVMQGDRAIFDEIYLYGANAVRQDWKSVSANAGDDAIMIACRAMGNTALTLQRSDIMNAVVGRQNEEKVGGASSVKGRVFNSALAVPMRPTKASYLSDVLFQEIGAQVLWRNHIADTKPPDILADVARLSETLKQIRQSAAKPSEGIVERKANARALLDRPGWIDDAKLRRFAAAGDADEEMEAIVAIRKGIEEIGVHELIRPQAEAVLKWSKDKANKSDVGRKPPPSLVDFGLLFKKELDDQLSEFSALIGELEELAERPSEDLRKLVQQTMNAVSEAQTAGRKLGSPLELQIDADPDIARNIDILTLALELGDPNDRETAGKRLRRWQGPSDPVKEMKTIVRKVFTDLEANRSDTELPEAIAVAARSGAMFSQRCDEWLRRLREILLRHDLAVERSEARRSVLLNLIGQSGSDIPTRNNRTKAFNTAFEPLAQVAQDVSPKALDESRIPVSNAERRRREGRRKELTERIEGAFNKAQLKTGQGHEPKGPLFERACGAFFDDLSENLRGFETLRRGDRNIVDKLVSAMNRLLEAIGFGPFNEMGGTDFRSVVEGLQRFSESVVEIFLEQSGFEIARFGGEESLRRIAAFVQANPFGRAAPVGSFNSRYVVLALPHAQSSIIPVEVGARRLTVRSLLAKSLGSNVEKPMTESAMPVLLVENRYNAAFQIDNIDNWRESYNAMPLNERALFHVVPNALSFPELVLEPANGGDFYWRCHAHDEIHDNSSREQFCTECVRDYVDGTRSVSEIVARPSADAIRAEPADAQGRIATAPITGTLVKVFDDGLPEQDRSPEKLLWLAASREEQELTGPAGWDPHNPPKLVWPQVPEPGGKSLEHVARSRHDGNRFKRLSTKELLHECGHCGFPIATDLTLEPGLGSVTCPRCRRELQKCGGCTMNDYVYVSASQIDAPGGNRICRRCTNEIPL